MRWLLRNLTSIILSLVLAIVVWFVAVERENPLVDQQIGGVPLQVLNQPAGTIILSPPPRTVSVTIRGPRQTLEALSPAQISASIDLAGAGRGQIQAPVRVPIQGRAMQLRAIDPSQVSLDLENIGQQTLPITVTVEGEPTRGFSQVGNRPQLSVERASVQGPAPRVDKVKNIIGRISIAGARSGVEQLVPIQPVDAGGKIVSGVSISPTAITVTVPIQQRADFADLPIRVRWQGQPAAGYRISNISVEPKSILVTGAPQVIASVPFFVETDPVDVEGAKEDVIRRVNLTLPEDTSPTESSDVLVEVKIEPIESNQTVPLPIEFRNLDRNLWATSSPDTVDVLLFGPLSDLQALKPGDVHVYLDATGLQSPGVYTLVPKATVLLPKISVINVLPDSVQVTLGTGPTPTPAVTPSPTPRK